MFRVGDIIDNEQYKADHPNCGKIYFKLLVTNRTEVNNWQINGACVINTHSLSHPQPWVFRSRFTSGIYKKVGSLRKT